MEGAGILEMPCSGSLGSLGRGRASLSRPVLVVLTQCPRTALGSPSRLWVWNWEQEMLPCSPACPKHRCPKSCSLLADATGAMLAAHFLPRWWVVWNKPTQIIITLILNKRKEPTELNASLLMFCLVILLSRKINTPSACL